MRLVRFGLRWKLLVAATASTLVAVLGAVALASPSEPAARRHGAQRLARSADDPVVGTWTWKFAPPGKPLATHGSVTFSKGGTMSWSGGNSGTWTRRASLVALTWKGSTKTVDTLTLSADNRTLTGKNNAGWSVQGIKKSGEQKKTSNCRKKGETEATAPGKKACARVWFSVSVEDKFRIVGNSTLRGRGEFHGVGKSGEYPDCRAHTRAHNGMRGTVLLIEYPGSRRENEDHAIIADIDLDCGHHEVWSGDDSEAHVEYQETED